MMGLGVIGLGLWFYKLDKEVRDRVGEQWFVPPVEFYAGAKTLVTGQSVHLDWIKSRMNLTGYRERNPDQILRPGDFSVWPREDCQNSLSIALKVT